MVIQQALSIHTGAQQLPYLWQVEGVICTGISKIQSSAKLSGPTRARQLVSGGGIPCGHVRVQNPLLPLHITLKFRGTPEKRMDKHDWLPVGMRHQVPKTLWLFWLWQQTTWTYLKGSQQDFTSELMPRSPPGFLHEHPWGIEVTYLISVRYKAEGVQAPCKTTRHFWKSLEGYSPLYLSGWWRKWNNFLLQTGQSQLKVSNMGQRQKGPIATFSFPV